MEEYVLKNLLYIIFYLGIFISNIYTQGESNLIFSFNIGLSRPGAPADFSDYWGPGYNLGLGIGKSISSNFEIQVNFNFNNFSLNHGTFIENIDTSAYQIDPVDYPYLVASGGERNILSLIARLKYLYRRHGGSKILPYGFIGLGAFRQYIDKIQILPSRLDIEKKMDTAFLSSFGLGMDLLLEEHTTLFFELSPEFCFSQSKTVVYYIFKIGFLIK